MRINNNIMAMNTHRQYGINNANVAKSVEKLSSGYRINRAGDDAAGLAISEKMRAQIRGLTMASKNSQDAISLVQTAEGALQETHNILQRMRELAVQSASDTNETTIDRDALNKEFQQLIAEIDDTADKTKFNEMGLINGDFAAYKMTNDATGAVNGVTVGGTAKIFANSLAVDADGAAVTFDFSVKATTNATGALTSASIIFNNKEYVLEQGQQYVTLGNGATIALGAALNFGTTTGAAFGAYFGVNNFDGNNANATSNAITASVTPTATGKEFVVQTGANKGDEMKINIDNMNAMTLGLAYGVDTATQSTINISSRIKASDAIEITNNAINLVSTQRAALGALQNRLEHKIANLDTSAENLQAAEARIRDLDMAKEMTTFTKNNILSQAATAMLAQANSLPQGVLQLLR